MYADFVMIIWLICFSHRNLAKLYNITTWISKVSCAGVNDQFWGLSQLFSCSMATRCPWAPFIYKSRTAKHEKIFLQMLQSFGRAETFISKFQVKIYKSRFNKLSKFKKAELNIM